MKWARGKLHFNHPAVPGRIVAAKKSLHYSDDGGNSHGPLGTAWAPCEAQRLALTQLDAEAALVAKNDDLYWRDSCIHDIQAIAGLPGEVVGDVAIDSKNSPSGG